MPTVLAADIGGTNCRLGLFGLENGVLGLERVAWIDTGSVRHTEELMLAFERELEKSRRDVDAVVVAIAGPVEEFSRGRLTNGGLEIDFSEHNSQGRRFFLINDFTAQAYAVVSPEGENAELIAGPEIPESDGVRGVIGAGTGLGQAALLRVDASGHLHAARWLAMPSEAGHTAYPFEGDRENEYHKFLCARTGMEYATGDVVVAGRGLSILHEFLTGEKLTPAEVGKGYLDSETETLDWYARFYGRACRHWMLTTLCQGGLWIAGGIAGKNPLVVKSAAFRKELYRHSHWEGLLRSIPVYLMVDENSGLWGAARFGQQQVDSAPRPAPARKCDAQCEP